MRRRNFIMSVGSAPALALMRPDDALAQTANSPATGAVSTASIPAGLPLTNVSGVTGELSSIRYRGISATETVSLLAQSAKPRDVNLPTMADKAMNYLTHNPRKELDYEPVFQIKPLACPPAPLGHDPIVPGDTDCRMDWEYIFMREMSGSKQGLDVQQGVRRRILKYVREDGLAWVPPGHFMEGEVYRGATPKGEVASTWATAKIIRSLSETYARTGDRAALAQARQMFVGLSKLADWKQGRATYAGGSGGWKDGKWLKAQQPTAAVEQIVRYWEVSGDSEARDFAIALTEGLIATGPQLKIESSGKFNGHMHSTLHGVWGVAHLGVLLNEPRYIEWAKRIYDYASTQGLGTGWLAAATWSSEVRLLSEMCASSDMISLAAWIAQGGYPDYWDHVEKYIRNMIVPSQFTMTPEYIALYRKVNASKGSRAIEKGLERMKDFEGGFIAAPAPNSWTNWMPHAPQSNGERMQIFGCCVPEAMRALHTAWSTTVLTPREGVVLVNTSFDRDMADAQVVSFLPSEPRLTVVAKKSADYCLRVPSWTQRDDVRAYRDGKQVKLQWGGPSLAYVQFANARLGEELTVRYPLVEFSQQVDFSFAERPDLRFKLEWVGNSVVAITPRAARLPMPLATGA